MNNSLHTRAVLVVDDDADTRHVLHEILSSEGYEVRVAENGVQALDNMRSARPPDIVVLDLMMPAMSGWEVLVTTDEDVVMRKIPIVVTSAMAAPMADPDRPGGVRMCLAKPLDVRVLLDALRGITLPRSPPAVA